MKNIVLAFAILLLGATVISARPHYRHGYPPAPRYQYYPNYPNYNYTPVPPAYRYRQRYAPYGPYGPYNPPYYYRPYNYYWYLPF